MTTDSFRSRRLINSAKFNALEVGDHRIECPRCGRGNSDNSAGLAIFPDGGHLLHCFRCAYVERYRPENGVVDRAPVLLPTYKPQASKRDTLNDWGLDFWHECSPLGGVALHYLKSRRCFIPPADGDLRWHPSVKHGPSGHTGPALVALITDALTGKPLSLHRTWITPTGKANVTPARLVLSGHATKGGCIRLWPDDCLMGGLALGEGIETCLSLAHAFEPVWATIDAGHLADFPVLAGVEVLTICRDNDPAGHKAAAACATRWVNAGRTVRVTRQVPNDMNDVLTRGAA